MHWNEEIYRQTLSFSAKAHALQKIGGMEIPYLKHISAVVMETLSALQHTPERAWDIDFALQCALLHDVIEDTSVGYDEIVVSFGQRVADGVLALTKNDALPRDQQMQDSLNRILQQPDEVRVVKMCDRIDNLYIPPVYWTTAKRKYYQTEGQLILDTLKGVCPYAEARLQYKINAYSNYLL
ncbi:MAG: bifunctional (p)ppGpp synthetase/guanosine-3',5'-bis(diphosphate) 3'-pyrophosphohydrolase [Bacteroidetes bacterium]|jgi:(p)ppGpp synthase/HD superfamily hydrolase|nr:MAG: bifunctional (p)ppGpp synthetase/guanosine-3',5'-bis(diphosphate) 3'-pyrophosphohydrolase [Bacteroidota bacterium]